MASMARNMVGSYHSGLYHNPMQTHHQDGGGGGAGGIRGCRSEMFRSIDSDHHCGGGGGGMTSLSSSRTDIYGRLQETNGQCSDRFQMQVHGTNLFGGLDDGFLSRPEVLSTTDLSKPSPPLLIKHDSLYGSHGGGGDMVTQQQLSTTGTQQQQQQQQQHLLSSRSHLHSSLEFSPSSGTDSMLNPTSIMPGLSTANPQPPPPPTGYMPASHGPQMYTGSVYKNLSVSSGGGGGGTPVHGMLNHMTAIQNPHHHHHQHHHHHHHHHPHGQNIVSGTLSVGGQHASVQCSDLDCDPRELEAFAEHFKQRRIKLGATQADVGAALGKLKLPGVGSLSQSTICRFESLTLSHNNMVALKPVLSAWLSDAERAAYETRMREELSTGVADKKRKRTSIAGPEKRSLEAYFAIQPRPSGEKIAQIADKLDLRKNVVRVWFCNQRQKQKRMKFSASTMKGPH